jgi:hypothetical protein
MKLQILELDSQDDRASVRDRLDRSQAPRVLLVFPNRGRTRLSRLDLVLLHRQAAQRGRELGLVSRHPVLQSAAEAGGIPHFATLDDVSEDDWPHVPQAISSLGDASRTSRLRELPPRPEAPRLASTQGMQRWFWVGIAAISLLALAAAIVPSAEVHLVPLNETRQQSLLLEPVASDSSDLGEGALPSRQVELELQGSLRIPTTGSLLAPDTPATGEALFTNLGSEPAPIPEGTSLRASSVPGVRFTTTIVAELPAGQGSTVSVPVRASLAGAAGNIAAGALDSIDGPLGLLASVSNPDDLSGGSDRAVAAVAPSDLTSLHHALESRLLEQALTSLLTELDPAEQLLPGTLRILAVLEQRYDHASGDPAESLGLEERVRIGALAADQSELEATVWSEIEAAVEPGWVPGRRSMSLDGISPDADRVGSSVQVDASWKVYRPPDRTLLARAISGRSVEDAAETLRRLADLAEDPRIIVHPAWLDRLPWIESRIQLTTPLDNP